MDAFRIQGGTRLNGRISVHGSKNACLPLMAAAIMADEPVELEGVPHLSDINNMGRLLKELGCDVTHDTPADDVNNGRLTLAVADATCTHARYDIVRTMRASICVLGPMLARRGRASVSMPGGCAFGHRPVDIHLRGLEALGAKIEMANGNIIATAKRLVGAPIFLGGAFGSTVLGTANVMSAAALAEGRTIIESAACEPEIADLGALLNAMGARIQGAGTPRLVIDGVERLSGATHRIIPDRIVAGTFAIAAGMTNGDVVLDEFPADHLMSTIDMLQRIGVHVERLDQSQDDARCSVRVTSERRLRPAMMTTHPYPGFPTDLQAQLMALLCLADGNSIVTEKIYPERFMHVAELARMGARLTRAGASVLVEGVPHLTGAPVMASDLRASASLVLAGMVAEGETIVSRVYHIDRGYASMETMLNKLGASIERIKLEQGADIESPQEQVIPEPLADDATSTSQQPAMASATIEVLPQRDAARSN